MEKPLPQLYQTKMKICYEQYRICHSKELKSLSILLADVFLRVPGVFFFSRWPGGACSFNTCLNVREVWAKSLRAISRYSGIKVLWLVKRNGQSWCSADIWRKRRAFETQFHNIIVSIFIKTVVKDHGDTFSPFFLFNRRKNYLLHNNIVQVQIFFPEGTHPSSEITEIQGVGKVWRAKCPPRWAVWIFSATTQ